MKKPMRRVRSLVLRNYLGSALVSFLIFTMLFALFGFDMEDQIFDNQVRLEADRLVADLDQPQVGKGITRALPMNYYIGTDEMPVWMHDKIKDKKVDGAYELFAEEHGHFHLAIRTLAGGEKLYVTFNARPYIRSTTHITAFIISILVIGCMVVLVTGYFIYRMTNKLSKPMEEIAAKVSSGNELDLLARLDDISVVELRTFLEALHQRDSRIQALLERERQFNRDASHELRTPLSIAMGAAEILENDKNNTKAFTRLKTSMVDMQSLTEGILWLSRDPDAQQSCTPVLISQNVVEVHKHIINIRPIEITVDGDPRSTMPVPKPVGLVIIGNLVRNAFSYTDEGKVQILVEGNRFSIFDTGIGFGNAPKNSHHDGFGIGLSLVKRLCEHFSLNMTISENTGGGSIVQISWK